MSTLTIKQKGKNFIEKHGEIWKFIKWTLFTGVGASGIELVVHMLLLNFVFVSLLNVPVTNSLLLYIRITNAGYMYAFFISSTLGYTIAFILNRKLTFKADMNAALSVTFAVILVVFNIFASTWLGSVLSSFSVANQWGSMGDAGIKVLTMVIPSIWIYPANRFIIHRVKKKSANRNVPAQTE